MYISGFPLGWYFHTGTGIMLTICKFKGENTSVYSLNKYELRLITRFYTTRELCPATGIWSERKSGSKTISQGQRFPFHEEKRALWKMEKDVTIKKGTRRRIIPMHSIM